MSTRSNSTLLSTTTLSNNDLVGSPGNIALASPRVTNRGWKEINLAKFTGRKESTEIHLSTHAWITNFRGRKYKQEKGSCPNSICIPKAIMIVDMHLLQGTLPQSGWRSSFLSAFAHHQTYSKTSYQITTIVDCSPQLVVVKF